MRSTARTLAARCTPPSPVRPSCSAAPSAGTSAPDRLSTASPTCSSGSGTADPVGGAARAGGGPPAGPAAPLGAASVRSPDPGPGRPLAPSEDGPEADEPSCDGRSVGSELIETPWGVAAQGALGTAGAGTPPGHRTGPQRRERGLPLPTRAPGARTSG